MSLKKPTSTEAKINWLCSERAIAEAEAATIEAMASFLGMKVLLPPYYLLILVLYTTIKLLYLVLPLKRPPSFSPFLCFVADTSWKGSKPTIRILDFFLVLAIISHGYNH